MRHINRHIRTHLRLSLFHIFLPLSLSSMCVFKCGIGINSQLLWARTVKILLLLLSNALYALFSIISLIKLNFNRDEKCVDSNFMCILLLMTRFESIKREDEEKYIMMTEERKEPCAHYKIKSSRFVDISFLFFSIPNSATTNKFGRQREIS